MAIRLSGLPDVRAHAAIDAAFAAVAHVHDRMSFHSRDSDVARLNGAAAGTSVAVDAETCAVLALARTVAAASRGVFDPTVAGDRAWRGDRPRPEAGRPPDPEARWTDLTLEGHGRVRLHRALRLDLGGIAKGHAVDRAVAVLIAHGVRQARIDAGGDLRIVGRRQAILLRTGYADAAVGLVHLADGSLASSGGRPQGDHAAPGSHRDGITRAPVAEGRFACVLAPSCAVADALTKVVLALGAGSAPILARFGAAAHLREADGRWLSLTADAA